MSAETILDNDHKARMNKKYIYHFTDSEHKLRLHNYVSSDITDNDHKQVWTENESQLSK
jgi:hypothetical protein